MNDREQWFPTLGSRPSWGPLICIEKEKTTEKERGRQGSQRRTERDLEREERRGDKEDRKAQKDNMREGEK